MVVDLLATVQAESPLVQGFVLGSERRVAAFILDHHMVDAILRHLERTGRHPERGRQAVAPKMVD